MALPPYLIPGAPWAYMAQQQAAVQQQVHMAAAQQQQQQQVSYLQALSIHDMYHFSGRLVFW